MEQEAEDRIEAAQEVALEAEERFAAAEERSRRELAALSLHCGEPGVSILEAVHVD